MIILGLLLCILATIVLYYQAGMVPLDEWFDVVAEKGDEVFHWGNITFDSIIENVLLRKREIKRRSLIISSPPSRPAIIGRLPRIS